MCASYLPISPTPSLFNFFNMFVNYLHPYKETFRWAIRVTASSECWGWRQCCVSAISSKNLLKCKIRCRKHQTHRIHNFLIYSLAGRPFVASALSAAKKYFIFIIIYFRTYIYCEVKASESCNTPKEGAKREILCHDMRWHEIHIFNHILSFCCQTQGAYMVIFRL